jgi:hypothetical protein
MRIDGTGSDVAREAVSAKAQAHAGSRPVAPALGSPPSRSQSGIEPRPASPSGREVTISFDDNKTVYRFIDSNTGKVLQQVPPEELLRVMRNIGEWLRQTEKKVDVSL